MTEELVPWDPPEPPAGGSRVVRWLLIAAVAFVVMGLIFTVLGPVRWAHDRSEASRRREAAATLASCLRFQSLVDQTAGGPVPTVELRSQVSALAVDAVEARTDVREAVMDLQREVMAANVTALTPAGARVTTACATR